jgi:hypothetical protein
MNTDRPLSLNPQPCTLQRHPKLLSSLPNHNHTSSLGHTQAQASISPACHNANNINVDKAAISFLQNNTLTNRIQKLRALT